MGSTWLGPNADGEQRASQIEVESSQIELASETGSMIIKRELRRERRRSTELLARTREESREQQEGRGGRGKRGPTRDRSGSAAVEVVEGKMRVE